MKFDKSRVYTAVNADELKIGSRCVFADTVKGLKMQMQSDNFTDSINVLAFARLHNEGRDDLFVASDGFAYTYAYLIEPPDEPKYKPFENLNSLVSGTNKHCVYIKSKKSVVEQIVGMTLNNDVVVDGQNGRRTLSAKDLLENYVFERDGSPCGVPVEE